MSLLLQTLCFHLGMTEAFVWDYGQPSERWTDVQETKSILMEIHKEIVKDNRSLLYSHTVSVLTGAVPNIRVLFGPNSRRNNVSIPHTTYLAEYCQNRPNTNNWSLAKGTAMCHDSKQTGLSAR